MANPTTQLLRDGVNKLTTVSTIDALLVTPTMAKINAAATTNQTLVKAGATLLKSANLRNFKAASVFVKIFDKATAPIAGTDVPVFQYALGSGDAIRVAEITGLYTFTLGFGYTITALAADNDATAVVAGDVVGFFGYT